MSNLAITKLGIIKGGNCEKWFKQRSGRERGAQLAVNFLLNNCCININKGWCQIIKIPKKIFGLRWAINNICKIHGGDAEIGWRRFISDIALPLYEEGKKFRLSKLKGWGASLAALEFGLTATIESGKFCYNKPHQDELYKKWDGNKDKEAKDT